MQFGLGRPMGLVLRMKIWRVRPKKVCGPNLLGLFCGLGSFGLMPTSVAWGELSSHRKLRGVLVFKLHVACVYMPLQHKSKWG